MTAQEKTTERTVSFDIEGEFISDFARTRVQEGAWERGLKFLTENIEGLTHEQAIAILKGEANLTGWASDAEGIQYAALPADGPVAQEMAERMDWLYGNVFRYGDTYWKPYACVTSWGEDDYRFSRKYLGPRAKVLDGTQHSSRLSYNPQNDLRSFYYARDPLRDMLVRIGEGKTVALEVLCEPTAMPPLWFTVSNNEPAQFIAQRHALRKLRLEERGAFMDDVPRHRVATASANAPDGLEDDEDEDGASEDSPVDDEPPVESVNTRAPRGHATKHEQARAAAVERAQGVLQQCNQRLEAATDYGSVRAVHLQLTREFAQLESVSLPGELYDQRDELERRLDDKEEGFLMETVRQQAESTGGWLKLKLTDDKGKPYAPKRVLEVPRNPFLLWALKGFDFEGNDKERPTWTPVCGSGMKMVNDDPYHSDWMLGAGLTLKDTYSDDKGSLHRVVRDSSFTLRHELVDEWTGAAFVTLAKGGSDTYFFGEVVFPEPNGSAPAGSIAVVPTAGPEYQLAMESACRKNADGNRGVLICETGGKLAHLATVGRELGCTVLMLPDARRKFREGTRLHVSLTEGKLTQML